MGEKRAARRDCSHERAKSVHQQRDTHIITDYEKGSLKAGLLIACVFGACLLHWAVIA